MNNIIVIFELANPGQNSGKILRLIKQHGWAKIANSAYIINSEKGPVDVRAELQVALRQGDKLFVGSAPAPSAWIGLPDEVGRWIIANQRRP